jgi:protein-tyrosine-phosphatase
MAEALATPAMHFESAGTAAVLGRPADPLALTVGDEMGVRLTDHVARPVTTELIARADAVFVMDHLNAASYMAKFGNPGGKMFLLGTPDGDPFGEIADPEGKSLEGVRACFAIIAARLKQLLRPSP